MRDTHEAIILIRRAEQAGNEARDIMSELDPKIVSKTGHNVTKSDLKTTGEKVVWACPGITSVAVSRKEVLAVTQADDARGALIALGLGPIKGIHSTARI